MVLFDSSSGLRKGLCLACWLNERPCVAGFGAVEAIFSPELALGRAAVDTLYGFEAIIVLERRREPEDENRLAPRLLAGICEDRDRPVFGGGGIKILRLSLAVTVP